MRNLIVVFLLLPILALTLASTALADMDQKCLNTCVNSGSSDVLCLNQCEYNQKQASHKKRVQAALNEQHNMFYAPVPLSGLILPPTRQVGVRRTTDYTCLPQCLREGSQYKYCEDSCAKQTCAPGAVLCRDTTGTTLGLTGMVSQQNISATARQ